MFSRLPSRVGSGRCVDPTPVGSRHRPQKSTTLPLCLSAEPTVHRVSTYAVDGSVSALQCISVASGVRGVCVEGARGVGWALWSEGGVVSVPCGCVRVASDSRLRQGRPLVAVAAPPV